MVLSNLSNAIFNSTKVSDGQKTMGRKIPLEFQEQKYNWTGSKTNPASITSFFWA